MKLLKQPEFDHFEQMAELEELYYGEAHIAPMGERFLRKYGFVPVCKSRQKTWVYSRGYGRFAGRAKKKP